MMENKVLNFIKENKMIKAGETVVIGVSGGADSVCLLHMMLKHKETLDIKLLVVHVHHGIRGETADRDARFVEELCNKNNIPFFLYKYHIPTFAKENGMSTEEAGRYARYEAFDKCLKENGVEIMGKIAVAHNKDDLAETVLLNLFRGSGIKGLKGIAPVRDRVIRPILCLDRSEIEKYLQENNLEYITDESNFTEDYTRNKIRLNILPQIKSEINEKAVAHIENTAANLALIDDYMESQCELEYDRLVVSKGEGLYIKEEFVKLHKAMQGQLIKNCLYVVAKKRKDISTVHINSVVDLFNMEVGKCVNLPYNIVAKREYVGVSIYIQCAEKTHKCDDTYTLDIQDVGEYVFDNGTVKGAFSIHKDIYNDCIFMEKIYTKWIQCDIMKVNLQLRTRRPGDYIVVDGKGSKKKLKDYFIDLKIPRDERDHILLLANGNEIVWIIGYRLNWNYRVTDELQNIYKLEAKMKKVIYKED